MTSPDAIMAELSRILSAVDYLSDLEGQCRSMVTEMSQAMLTDVIEGRGLQPMAEYIGHYCDVLDSPADADRIAAEI
jgi:hypothetical protein